MPGVYIKSPHRVPFPLHSSHTTFSTIVMARSRKPAARVPLACIPNPPATVASPPPATVALPPNKPSIADSLITAFATFNKENHGMDADDVNDMMATFIKYASWANSAGKQPSTFADNLF